MSFHDFAGPEAVAAYAEKLRTGYPQRTAIIAYILKQLATQPSSGLRVLELCVGPGVLAEEILASSADLTYVGLDFSAPFLAFATERLASDAKRVSLLKADLRNNTWPQQVEAGTFDAIVTMQSLHDVGDEACISSIYQQCHPLLVAGGFFLNADLIPEGNRFDPDRPGRLTIETHQQLLSQAGFRQVACTLQDGNFACSVGFAE